MNCVSWIYACTTFGLFVFFPGVFLLSRVTGACPVTTDLIMRVNVRTTITTSGRMHRQLGSVFRSGPQASSRR